MAERLIHGESVAEKVLKVLKVLKLPRGVRIPILVGVGLVLPAVFAACASPSNISNPEPTPIFTPLPSEGTKISPEKKARIDQRSGPNYPKSTVGEPTSPNGFGWYNLTGAQQMGEAPASAASNSYDPVQMDTLANTDFGFRIPPNATITGIVAEVNHHASQNNAGRSITDAIVQLAQNGKPVGTNKADTVTQWKDTDYVIVTYGSSTDLWGMPWSPSDINDPNFGLNFAPQGKDQTGGTTSADIKGIRVTVFYVVK